ncbi:MAG TPA: hypothetical protein VEJ84_10245, partial [Acidimicrobiales bacterium]|nr:hypothetical protein [Acidimicrobiales bacterium]
SGAYSSIFIASPVLALLKEREPRYVEIRRRLAAYPQSRQVLTPDTVAGGALIGSKALSSVSVASSGTSGASGAARKGKPNGGSAAADSTKVGQAPEAAPQVALAATAPPAVAVGPNGEPDNGDLGNGDLGNGDLGNGAPGPGGPAEIEEVLGVEVAEVAVASEIEVAARPTGSQPGVKAGAGARSGSSSGNGARRAPPRSRKKTPRRR